MGFSRQEYWSGLPYPPPGDLSDPGIKPTSLTSLALAGGFFTASARGGRPRVLLVTFYTWQISNSTMDTTQLESIYGDSAYSLFLFLSSD